LALVEQHRKEQARAQAELDAAEQAAQGSAGGTSGTKEHEEDYHEPGITIITEPRQYRRGLREAKIKAQKAEEERLAKEEEAKLAQSQAKKDALEHRRSRGASFLSDEDIRLGGFTGIRRKSLRKYMAASELAVGDADDGTNLALETNLANPDNIAMDDEWERMARQQLQNRDPALGQMNPQQANCVIS